MKWLVVIIINGVAIIYILFIPQYKTKQYHKLQINLQSAEIRKSRVRIVQLKWLISITHLHQNVNTKKIWYVSTGHNSKTFCSDGISKFVR